jgi:hypothetical protein
MRKSRHTPEIDYTGNTLRSPRFLCRPTAFFRLAGSRQRALYTETADLPLLLCVDTFPRFVAIGFYFLSETLIPIASPIIFLFIHNYLTLRKWCYTPLQHNFPLDPMISSFHIFFLWLSVIHYCC